MAQLNNVMAHLTTAFVFALQHVALAVLVLGKSVEWSNLPGFALFGLCLTLLYQRDRSLLAPLAVHVLANALSIAFLLAR